MSTQHSESFFVERASTGRFCRLEASDGDTPTRGKRLPILHEKIISDQFVFIGFLFLQGIISGLSVSALYEAFALDSPKMFVAHLAARANKMTQRCFFIGLTFCVTGSLCMLKEDDVSQIFAIIKGSSGSTPQNVTKSVWSIWCSIISYFIALMFTLLCYHVAGRMSNYSTQIHFESVYISDEELISILHQWQGFIVTRSILCFVAWLILCYRFVIMHWQVPSGWTEEFFI
jgi:hypothetical protein